MKKILSTSIFMLLLSAPVMADSREAIVMTEPQRQEMLKEMRELLESSQQVLAGVVSGDMELVEKAARASGMNRGSTTPPAIAKLLPGGFKSMGPETHKGFERIANEADGFGDTDKILSILAQTQENCVNCHKVYQFKVNH